MKLLIILLLTTTPCFSKDIGTIYIMTNQGNKYVKIGRTSKDVLIRKKQLDSATGVATPFQVVFAKQVTNYKKIEKELHKKFNDKRINNRREFFDISPHTVSDTLNKYKGLVIVEKERRENFNFKKLGLVKKKIKFKNSQKQIATIHNEKLVEYKKELYTLSGLTAKLLNKDSSEGISALDYWIIDISLSTLRDQHE